MKKVLVTARELLKDAILILTGGTKYDSIVQRGEGWGTTSNNKYG